MTVLPLRLPITILLGVGQVLETEVVEVPPGHISAEAVAEALRWPRPGVLPYAWLPPWHPALRYRVLTPSEAMRMEAVLGILRDRPLEHFFAPGTDCKSFAVVNLFRWLHKWPHAAAIAECVRILETQLRRLKRYPQPPPPGWDHFWVNLVTSLPSERRLYAAVYHWGVSPNPCLRKASRWYRREFLAAWRGMSLPPGAIRDELFIWPLPPVGGLIAQAEPSRQPGRGLVGLIRRPYELRGPRLSPAASLSAQLIVSTFEDPVHRFTRPGPARWSGAETIRGALKTIVRDTAWPLHLRLQALDVLVRSLGDYDRQLLRRLARDSSRDFGSEVLSLAAVCALSRCPNKDALHDLVDLVRVGPEWVAFQAASHLRFVAGLEIPPLIAMSDQGIPGVINSGDWIDVAHWLVDREERQRVCKQLHAQIEELPERWPWHDMKRIEPLILHEHVDPRSLRDQKDVPAIVNQRSAGEDFFWKPYERPHHEAR